MYPLKFNLGSRQIPAIFHNFDGLVCYFSFLSWSTFTPFFLVHRTDYALAAANSSQFSDPNVTTSCPRPNRVFMCGPVMATAVLSGKPFTLTGPPSMILVQQYMECQVLDYSILTLSEFFSFLIIQYLLSSIRGT